MTDRPYRDFGVLLVDNEPAWLRSLSHSLCSRAGLTHLVTCQDGAGVLPLLDAREIGLVLLDLDLPGPSGEELLDQITERHPEVLVVMISGDNQLDTVVRCIKRGAFDYFAKTDDQARIVSGVLRALQALAAQRTSRDLADRMLSREIKHPEAFARIITADQAMLSIFAYLEAVARSPHPLAVQGESGTGKEQIVEAAHRLSGCQGRLVAVNVAGLDDAMFADTLFGHVKGAFTGANGGRRGLIEEAADGTLFLDEIGDLSLISQVKLLRLLQEGEYFPLGSDQSRRLRARIIVATHQRLKDKVEDGRFRRDLYYRLLTHQVELPPLRCRTGDLRMLVEHFLAEDARCLGRPVPRLPRGLLNLLAAYPFPGNIRELKAMLFDAVSITVSDVLATEHLLPILQADGQEVPWSASAQNPFAGFDRMPSFRQAAQLLVEEALTRAGGNQTLAARILGISQPALSKRMKLMRADDNQRTWP